MRSLPRWLFAMGFSLLIFGGKLWFIDAAGSDLPTWDQWDAEGEVVLRPWLEGWMRAKEIFHPHNEHRVVTTKLYALGLFVANRQWDAFVETTANAAVHTASALVLLLLARRWLARPWLGMFAVLLAVLFTLPFSWENTLFGFQVPFYFLLLFSIGHVALTLQEDRFSGRWGLGQLCGALAVLSLASGFFSALAILAVLGHRFVRERRWNAQQITTAVLAAGFAVAGWKLKNDVPGHAYLRAHGPVEFGHALLQLVAWPGSATFPWSLLLFGPAVVFAVRRVRARATEPAEAVLLGLFLWLVLQCLATAYARGAGAVLSPRYFDLLALNVALGFVFLIREFAGRTRIVLAALWLAGVGAGLAEQSRTMWRDFVAPNIPRQARQEENVRDYLRTRDPAHLLNKPWGEVPYPVGETLVERLKVPVIQEVMPPSVRRSVPVGNGAPSELPPGLPAPVRPVALSTWSLPSHPQRFHWRSALQPDTSLPVLRFRIAGDLGNPDRDGELLVRSASGEVSVVPDTAPGNRWKTANVFRPAGEWWLEATAPSAGAWFAFTEPVEVGRWTWVAEKLLKYHFVLMAAGLALVAASGWSRRRADA
ncbi:MAG: hypothetical protein JWM88_3088 [Verrucomicrobia bacterium]|nr:hypothetical protein [Verrucomicrobiota bacterium]